MIARLQEKLKDAEKALFSIALGNNEQEKIHLNKVMDANKLEHEALLIKLERNKKAQDSLANVSDQIKKVMNIHQEKLRKIN